MDPDAQWNVTISIDIIIDRIEQVSFEVAAARVVDSLDGFLSTSGGETIEVTLRG